MYLLGTRLDGTLFEEEIYEEKKKKTQPLSKSKEVGKSGFNFFGKKKNASFDVTGKHSSRKHNTRTFLPYSR